MKASELKGQSGENLAQTLKDTEKHLFQLRFQSATDRLETPSEIRKARRDIARIKTVQRQRDLGKLAELPADSAPAIALGPPTADRARTALDLWHEWFTARKKLA